MNLYKKLLMVCLGVAITACTKENSDTENSIEEPLAPLPMLPLQISTISDPVGIVKGAVNVQFQIDNSGNGLAVWNQYLNGYWHIYGNEYFSDLGWGTPFQIDGTDNLKTWQHQLSVNKNGNAIVTWRDDEKGWYKFYNKGIGWSEAKFFNDLGSACHKVLMRIDGTALCLYTKWIVDHYSLFAKHYSPENGWNEGQIIDSPDGGSSYTPQLVEDSNGYVITIWKQYSDIQETSSIASFWTNRYIDGAGWEAPNLIESDDSGSVISADIAVSGSGDIFVVWDQYDGPSYLPGSTRIGIYFNIYRQNLGWEGEIKISENDGHDSLSPRIAINNNGDGLVAWGSSSSPAANRPPYAPSVRAKYITEGVLTNETLYLSSENTWDGYADISLDGDGKVAIVWSSSELLYHNVYDPDEEWRGTDLLGGFGGGIAPVVNIETHQRVMVSWVEPEFQYDGSNSYTFQIWGYVFE